MSEKPDPDEVKRVAAAILAAVGTEQMSELSDTVDDLLWDYYEPYHRMSDEEGRAWRNAFREEVWGWSFDE